ncbi:MAG TPA: alpha/beta hydrolase [Acidimicrobiia bacterium]|nr:alpha/beta hydrolase [Acidimicrobiia bacterium]
MSLIDIGDTRLFVRDEGEGSAVLFIHGFPLDHTVWLDQVAGMRNRHRCIAPDLRGYGMSDRTIETTIPMRRFAEDLVILVERLELDRVDVVGLSMGGYVALALWELAPQVVRSMVLMDTRAGADGEAARAKRDDAIAVLLTGGRPILASNLVGALLTEPPLADAAARLRTMAEGTPYETIVASLRGMRDRRDRTGMLDTISVPTLVISGAEDRLMSAEDQALMTDTIPGATAVVIDGASHLPSIEKPQETTAVLREFLSQV